MSASYTAEKRTTGNIMSILKEKEKKRRTMSVRSVDREGLSVSLIHDFTPSSSVATRSVTYRDGDRGERQRTINK